MSGGEIIRTLSAGGHPLLREAPAAGISSRPGMATAGQAASGYLKRYESQRP